MEDLTEQQPSPVQKMNLTYHQGDIFDAGDDTVLVHACNCQGTWGAGIALAFKDNYPAAYQKYRSYCRNEHDPKLNPVSTGTCLLIEPCETDTNKPKHWIACLFTSSHYGSRKDDVDDILSNTKLAVENLMEQITKAKDSGYKFNEIRCCKINSARFGVPWIRTAEVLQDIEVEPGCCATIQVWDRC